MKRIRLAVCLLGILSLWCSPALAGAPPATNPQTGAVGLNGFIGANAPASAPTITTPTNGASFTSLPVNVAGLCTGNVLIEIFKNNVFSGSTVCVNNSFNLQIDLFSGRNDLIARAYDALNQSSPDSNTVSVTFSDQINPSGPRVQIISSYATRGANPNTQLTWPLTITGGTSPYAISVDWGDGTSPELISQKFSGDFNISHTYARSGTYNVTIKVTDSNGDPAFLQVVAVANGPVTQSQATSASKTVTKVLWWPLIVLFVLMISTFWLGRKHQAILIRDRIRSGRNPF